MVMTKNDKNIYYNTIPEKKKTIVLLIYNKHQNIYTQNNLKHVLN